MPWRDCTLLPILAACLCLPSVLPPVLVAAPVTTSKRTAPPPVEIHELHDITDIELAPPGPPPSRWPLWATWALVLGLPLIVAGLVLGGWGLTRRRSRSAPDLPATTWALQELDRLEGLGLPEAGEAERYHTLLSDILRRYLERRFGYRASEQTTPEFFEAVRREPQFPEAQQHLLRDFLERCDLAKFAGVPVAPEECRRAGDMARSFIQQTAPASVPQAK